MAPKLQAALDSAGGRASPGEGAPLLLIVAADDLRRLVADALPTGFRLLAAPDAATGLRDAEALRPNLVLLDAGLVGGATEGLVRSMRQSPELAATLVIAVTGQADDELRVRLLRAGAHDWLAKPFSPEELRARVANLFAVRQTNEAQARLASLVENAPDGIFVADLDARYTDVNEAGCRMLGYDRDELIGKTILDLILPEEVPKLAESKAQLLGGKVHVAEWKLRKKDGTYLPVEVSAKILADGRWQGFVRDISERARNEAALRRAQAISSGILLTSVYAIISIDRQQRVTMFNQGAERIFGYSAQEMLGAPLERLVAEKYHAALRKEVHDFLAGPATSHAMGTLRAPIFGQRKSGEEFPADAAISKVAIGDEVIGTVALRDVSEERRAETEQRVLAEVGAALTSLDPNQMLENVANVAVRSLADFSSLFLVRDESPKLKRVAAASKDPALAWSVDLLMTNPLQPRPEHIVWRAVETSKPVIQELTPEDYPGLAESPEHLRALLAGRPRSALAVPMILAGRCVGVLSLTSSGRPFDLRDLRLAEKIARRCVVFLENARLYRAEKQAVEARDQVLSLVAHDLRNPLNAIVLQAGLLRRHDGGPERRSLKSADAIAGAARRMNHIIEDLLDVTMLESGRFTLDRSALPVSELLEAIAAAQGPLVASHALRLELAVAPRLPEVWADRQRVFQIIENLVGNASKFTPSGGTITLGAASSGPEVRFWVSDTGSGIPPEHLPRLFDRFWQSDLHHRGAGLGLSIVKGIVDAHGGRLWVESTIGAGSTFTFTLPALGPAEEAPESFGRAREPEVGLKGSVLVAEDDTDVREALSALLESHGYQVDAVENGAEALERLRQAPAPTVIIIDLAMPVMDGWGFLAERSKDPAIERLPVIVASGQRGVEKRVAAQNASFLPKPVSEARLLELLGAARAS